MHSSLVGHWGGEGQWASELSSQSQKLHKLGLLADWRGDGRTNTGLTATLTESEVKARKKITAGVSLDFTQAQDKMGIIWGK